MYCILKKEEVIEGLSKAIGIIPLKSGSSFLRSLWLEARDNSIRIMATDSTTEFTGIYQAEVKKEGNVGVNAKAFVDLIKKLPNDEITLEYEEEERRLHIKQGRRNYKLSTADSTWFKPLDDFPEENSILWAGDLFQDLIDKTYFCISDDDSSEQLACFFMKKVDNLINCCGLNGHQLAVAMFDNDDLANLLPENGLLLQKKYTAELRKWLAEDEIHINITENKLFLKNASGTEIVSFVRSDYNYPNHQAFLDRIKSGSPSILTVNRKEMVNALERIMIFNNDTDRCTYFDLSENELQLSAQGQEVGQAQEILEVKYEGDISKIAFPTRNLIDIIGHYKSEEIIFTFTGVESPCGVSGEQDNDYTVIIMPMKIASTNMYDE